jgi:PEP-CTERM/exosortase A-associated glycosyltransferase
MFELGDASAADRILDRRSADLRDDVDAGRLRAEVDWRLGRNQAALAAAESLLSSHPADRDAIRIRDLARSEAVALQPGWRPRIDLSLSRIEPVHGRVLHLLTNSLPYRQAGYTVRAQNVARCQIEVGLEPHMVTRAGFPRSDGIRSAPLTELFDGVTYHRLLPELLPGSGPEQVAELTAKAAAPLLADLRPAVLQPASNHLNASAALALGDAYGIPVVYEVRGFLEETWLAKAGEDAGDSERYRASRDAETDCMRSAAAVVTLSETMRVDIVARGGIDPDRVVVVPNGVDVERFHPVNRDAALAERLSLGDEPVIGYISSLSGYEGIRYLILAAAELRRRGRRVRCLLVGEGDDRAALEATARSAGVDDGTVVFAGRVPYDRIVDYYALIDVFVVPRTADRVSQLVTPLKPYEAMAMERALVVSDVAALREIVVEGETGRIFRPEDPIALADAVEPLLDDPVERLRLGRAARAWVTEHRTWRQNGLRYLDLYRRMGVG